MNGIDSFKGIFLALTNVAKILLQNFDTRLLFQEVVDSILKELSNIDHKYKIIVLSLIEGENLKRISLTFTEEAHIALTNVEVKFEEIIIPMSNVKNLGVKSIVENQIQYTSDFAEILSPPLSIEHARHLQQLTGIKNSMVYPIFADEEPLGSMIFSIDTDLDEVSDLEKTLIQSYVVLVGIAIENAELFNKNVVITKQLTQANTKLADALKKEKDMMDIIGHELRTPLGAARNALLFLDTLKQKGKMTDQKYKQFMETAIRNIRREKEILETILQSARLDNDRIQFDPTDVNIQELIKQSFEGFGDMAKQKNLEVILDIEPRLTIRCDQVAIQQIVDNLASNAVKYTHKGSITIRIKKAENNKIRFEFIDTGEGLKPEDIPNLGKKFFRANTHLQTGGTIGGDLVPRPGGTGIGLYVIKGLLESMGSELKIESEFGKGSKFWFELEDSSEV